MVDNISDVFVSRLYGQLPKYVVMSCKTNDIAYGKECCLECGLWNGYLWSVVKSKVIDI